jgi:hypothetical protein
MCKASPGPLSQNLSFKLSEDGEQASHRSTGGSGQVQRFRQRDEPDSEVLQFLERRQQIRYRPAPPVQAPHQHNVDLAAARSLEHFLAGVSPRRSRAHLADLQGDHPAAPGGILPHGPVLHRQRLLIIRRDTRIQARA